MCTWLHAHGTFDAAARSFSGFLRCLAPEVSFCEGSLSERTKTGSFTELCVGTCLGDLPDHDLPAAEGHLPDLRSPEGHLQVMSTCTSAP